MAPQRRRIMFRANRHRREIAHLRPRAWSGRPQAGDDAPELRDLPLRADVAVFVDAKLHVRAVLVDQVEVDHAAGIDVAADQERVGEERQIGVRLERRDQAPRAVAAELGETGVAARVGLDLDARAREVMPLVGAARLPLAAFAEAPAFVEWRGLVALLLVEASLLLGALPLVPARALLGALVEAARLLEVRPGKILVLALVHLESLVLVGDRAAGRRQSEQAAEPQQCPSAVHRQILLWATDMQNGDSQIVRGGRALLGACGFGWECSCPVAWSTSACSSGA